MTLAQKSETPLAGGVTQEPNQSTDPVIVSQPKPDRKEFTTIQALFACAGHELTVSRRVGDGRCTWTVSRWGRSRNFCHWGDVLAFLAQIGGVR